MILIVLLSFLYLHYISSHYPWNCKETFKEKTLKIYFRVLDYKPTIIYIISLSFPLLLPLQLQILERFLAQTLTSPNLSVQRSFGACGEVLEEAIDWQMQFGANCGIQITSEDKIRWNPLGARTQRVQYIELIRLRGFYWYSCTLTLFISG